MIALCPPHHDKLDIDPNLLKDCTEEEIEEMEMEAEKEYEKALGNSRYIYNKIRTNNVVLIRKQITTTYCLKIYHNQLVFLYW